MLQLIRIKKINEFFKHYLKNLYRKYFYLKQKFSVILEYNTFLNKISENKDYIYVYDTNTSPPKYGDFMHCLFFVRYLSFYVKQINFYLITDTNNKDWDGLTSKNIIQKEFKSIITFILPSNVKYYFISSNDFFYKHSNKDNIIFKKKILTRKPIYLHSLNMINHMYKKKSNDKFIFEKNQILNLTPKYFKNLNYIALAARLNETDGHNRDMTDKEFQELVKIIKRKTKLTLVIVSDNKGTAYFKNISNKNNLEVIFSNDYGLNFIENSLVCANALCFIQFKGGGLATLPIYSTNPYFIHLNAYNEIYATKKNIGYWSNEDQLFIHNDNFEKFINDLEEIRFN